MSARDARVHRDWMNELVDTPGWALLARFVQEEIQFELDRMERGFASWDEYRWAVGRVSGLRSVLDRPGVLIEEANEIDRGDR